jgi:hypothetical protein
LQDAGSDHATSRSVEHPRAGPGHAFEKPAAINAVAIVIVKNDVRHDFSFHFTSPTGSRGGLFQERNIFAAGNKITPFAVWNWLNQMRGRPNRHL